LKTKNFTIQQDRFNLQNKLAQD